MFILVGVGFWVFLFEGGGYAGAPGPFGVAGVNEDASGRGGEDGSCRFAYEAHSSGGSWVLLDLEGMER